MARTAKTRAKLGPVSAAERAGYRARLPNDAAAGRPTETTARTVCGLLGVDPAVLRSARDQVDGDRVAAQAFTAAFILAVSSVLPSPAAPNAGAKALPPVFRLPW